MVGRVIEFYAVKGLKSYKILKINIRYKGNPVITSVDIYWELRIPRWIKNGNEYKVEFENAHASYHNSGETHVRIEKGNTILEDSVDNIDPPLKLSKETRLYCSPMIYIADENLFTSNIINAKNKEIVLFDVTRCYCPLYKLEVFFLPVASSQTTTIATPTANGMDYLIRSTNPWCRIVFTADLPIISMMSP